MTSRNFGTATDRTLHMVGSSRGADPTAIRRPQLCDNTNLLPYRQKRGTQNHESVKGDAHNQIPTENLHSSPIFCLFFAVRAIRGGSPARTAMSAAYLQGVCSVNEILKPVVFKVCLEHLLKSPSSFFLGQFNPAHVLVFW